ncbi:MAG TPA: hypothetical protein DCS93_12405 [Microscillaceae bacterium]|nr:hypothetical protein [Microscillaceae bacterium]
MTNKLYAGLLLGLTILLGFAQQPHAQTANCSITTSTVNDGSFETPNLAYKQFQYRPTSSTWTFTGSSGISDNKSGFTGGNANAPSGSQVLFLQNISKSQKTIQIATTGAYRIRFYAAQRTWFNTGQGQSVRVSLDQNALPEIRPVNSQYQIYRTAIWWLTAGSHTLSFEGTATTGDQTAFVDDIRLEKLPLWSQASSWQGGSRPTVNSNVTIPAGCTMVLDNSSSNQGRLVNVSGTLTTALNGDFSITAQGIHVMNGGTLQIGFENTPYTGNGTITLAGSNPSLNLVGMMGAKFIGAMSGGKVELHGQPKLSWTQLGASVNAGGTSITLKEPVDWKKDDRIVIASTDFDMNHAEERVISSVSINKRTVHFNDPLDHDHYGSLQTYSGNNRTWTLDERAEVGLLSRNLVIQGDASSESSKFGGHIMVMSGSISHISNVELFRMGQRDKLGRYPFHWHRLGNANGQYFSHSSVHHSFNRAITVHSTNNTTVEKNVCYDNLGHAIFLEDGNETGNEILNNLGMVTRRPDRQYALLPSDTTKERNASGPATFWITHPNNKVQNNRAAGSDGSGFWFAFHQNRNSESYQPGLQPNLLNIPAGYIDGNTAHSSYHGWLVGMGPNDGDLTQTPSMVKSYTPSQAPTIDELTVYKNQLGNYSRIRGAGNTYTDMIVADNWEGEASTWQTDYRRVLWVGASNNYEPVTNIPDTMAPSERVDSFVVGHIIYDGPVHIYDSYFTGFNRPKFSLFDQWGATIRYMGHSMTNTKVASGPGQYKVHFRKVQDSNGTDLQSFWFAGMIYDLDGSFTGKALNAITRDADILKEPSSPVIYSNLNAIESQRRYCYVELRSSDENYTQPRMRRQTSTLYRSDGASFTELRAHAALDGFGMPVMVNEVYSYRYEFSESIPAISRFDYHSMSQGEYFILEVPNIPTTAKVYSGTSRGNYDHYGSLSLLPSRSTLSSLKSTTGSAYYYNSFQKRMYIRYQAPTGADFKSNAILGSIFICLNNNCADGASLPLSSIRTAKEVSLPKAADLVYPNPFLNTLTLSLELPKEGQVSLKIFDLVGRLQKTNVYKNLKAGKQLLEVDVQALKSGTYLYHLQVGEQLIKGKIVKE